MSDAVYLAAIGVVLALVNGVLVVVIGAWADGRRKRAEANAAAEGKGIDELSKVRAEYREEIKALRVEMKELRDRLDAKERENRELSVTVARQADRIADLEADLAQLHKERAP